VVAAARTLEASGLNQPRSGNISVRTDDGFLVTPSGVPAAELTESSIAHMDLEGTYAGPVPPSSEWRMHLSLYRSRADAGAMVHAHPTFATALSCLRREIPPFHYMVAVAGGTNIRCAPYATFGTVALSAAMLAALHERQACLLANHGLVALGQTLPRAIELAIEVETLARQFCQASLMGEPVLLNEQQMDEVLDRFRVYGKPEAEVPAGGQEILGFPPRRA
jgi:L-fuculose-phosphate aldolase